MLLKHKIRKPWYKYVTVEPTMFLYMMAYMITEVIEQTFYVFRACTVDHGYSEEICYNITGYKQINLEVQVTVSNFHQWNGVAWHIVPVFLAFFLGAYSDKRGRKSIMLAGLIGKLYFSMMLTLNSMKDWPVMYVIYTAKIPSAFTGADLAIFAGAFAYIADVSSAKSRTFRVGILDAVYLSTMPLGVFIGNIIYVKFVNKSFTTMFVINTTLILLATLHCLFFLKWQTRPEQMSLRDAGVKNPIVDFFDLKNVKQTMLTLVKKRSNHRTLFLWFLLISMALYTFQRDERPYMYLYVQNVFEWDPTAYSNFRTYVSTAYVLTMFVGIPLMTKMFHWRDTVIVMLGAASHMLGHFLYAQATVSKTLYIGGTVAALGPCVAPLVRSMTSKILPTAERGVAYAFLSVMENAVAMFGSIIYSQVYNVTLGTNYVNAIFYLTISTQAVVFLFALCMEITLRGRRLESLLPHEEREIQSYIRR
ncbi:probable peptidoglycan muropeptide transporter SLC46 isoform X2 [Cydia pomonella]|uniref:probable peptidoglycan muropeptide transporter SLC46 isoform X2 n=1 Tax=Cydia pomonella TaxID=82600 RepID=UPI002ADE45C2|nr:probable peptidoglycan muropeptide transporter SLC46 isoform X2 [Cydia pomonella]